MNEIFENVNFTDITSVTDALAKIEFIPMLVALIACVTLAFCAFKFYRICITAALTFGFGMLGNTLAGTLLENLSISLPIDIALEPAISLVLALIGAIIGLTLPRFATFLVGAGAGYLASSIAVSFLGSEGAGITFFEGTVGSIIVAVVCAIVAAFLLLIFFKFFYILLTSVVPMALAGLIIATLVLPDFALIALIAGAVVGIIAMIYQFKKSSAAA